MDMTRDFLNAILELDAPHIVESGDIRLVDKDRCSNHNGSFCGGCNHCRSDFNSWI